MRGSRAASHSVLVSAIPMKPLTSLVSDIEDFGEEVPEKVYSTLSSHLPHSLPLLRRIQFMNVQGGKTSDSHVLLSLNPSGTLVVAYLDSSRGPETELWCYSSLEREQTTKNESDCEEQIISMLRRAADIEKKVPGRGETAGVVLIGSLHEKVLDILRKHRLTKIATEPYFKFLFKSEMLPTDLPLPSIGLQWSTVNQSDIPLVLSRTDIPRKERTIILLPSVAIRSGDDLIAWGFLGPDGSLTSLHCEEGYRGRGLAKAVALKLFRERNADFGIEKLHHADVGRQNLQSQGVCKSLGGVQAWTVYWCVSDS